jgi:hypothetical protein
MAKPSACVKFSLTAGFVLFVLDGLAVSSRSMKLIDTAELRKPLRI